MRKTSKYTKTIEQSEEQDLTEAVTDFKESILYITIYFIFI